MPIQSGAPPIEAAAIVQPSPSSAANRTSRSTWMTATRSSVGSSPTVADTVRTGELGTSLIARWVRSGGGRSGGGRRLSASHR